MYHGPVDTQLQYNETMTAAAAAIAIYIIIIYQLIQEIEYSLVNLHTHIQWMKIKKKNKNVRFVVFAVKE